MKNKKIISTITTVILILFSTTLISNIQAEKNIVINGENSPSIDLNESKKCSLCSFEQNNIEKIVEKPYSTFSPIRCTFLFIAYIGFLLFGSAEAALLIAFQAKNVGCLWA